MIQRCHNPKATGYKYYGLKGIKVCNSWKESFYNFYQDMGPRPDGCSLDRINFKDGYYLENCRWATNKIQANNKSDRTLLTFNGVSQSIADWAKQLGLIPNTLQYRLLRGWSIERALTATDRIKKDK